MENALLHLCDWVVSSQCCLLLLIIIIVILCSVVQCIVNIFLMYVVLLLVHLHGYVIVSWVVLCLCSILHCLRWSGSLWQVRGMSGAWATDYSASVGHAEYHKINTFFHGAWIFVHKPLPQWACNWCKTWPNWRVSWKRVYRRQITASEKITTQIPSLQKHVTFLYIYGWQICKIPEFFDT